MSDKKLEFTTFQRISQIVLTLMLIFAVIGLLSDAATGAVALIGIGISLFLLAHVELLTRYQSTDALERNIHSIKHSVDDIKQMMESVEYRSNRN